MKFVNLLSGILVAVFGALIGYIDYLILNTFYSVSLWISTTLHAPESLAVLITLILVLSFFTIILLIALVSLYVIVIGVALIFSD